MAQEDRDRLGRVVTLSQTKSNYSAPIDPLQLRRGHHGELIPLDADDQQTIDEAMRDGGSAAKAAERQSAKKSQAEDDDIAAAHLWHRHPGASLRTLKAEMMRGGVGAERAQNALMRTRPKSESVANGG